MTPNSFQSIEEFISGSILLIDKPYEWTSFDVLNRVKSYVRQNIKIPPNDQGHSQRFKIGHAGTLDPLATGLLVVCTGKFTKRIDEFQGGEKEYTGTICFGKTTPSFDLETQPEGEYPFEHLTNEMLIGEANKFIGLQMQQPPAYSAKHVDGKRAYLSARKGEDVIIPKVSVEIKEFELTRFDLPEADFRISCSKGTYIRTIANDIGQRLQTGSHLKALRRTGSSPFTIAEAMTLEDLLARLAGFSTI